MNYINLDNAHKREILTNAHAFLLALNTLAKITPIDHETWSYDFQRSAVEIVDSLSDQEIDEAILLLEQARVVNNTPFTIEISRSTNE